MEPTPPAVLPFDWAAIASALLGFFFNFCCVTVLAVWPTPSGGTVSVVGEPPSSPASPFLDQDTALVIALSVSAVAGVVALILGAVAFRRGRAKLTRGAPLAIAGMLMGAVAVSQPCVAGCLVGVLDGLKGLKF